MGKKRDNHSSNWASKGGGMHRHATSGVPHNHRNTIEMNREAARQMEEEARLKAKQKGKMFNSVKDLFGELGFN